MMSVAAVFSSIFLLSLFLISSSQSPDFDDVVLQRELNRLSLVSRLQSVAGIS